MGLASSPLCQISHAQLNKERIPAANFKDRQINQLIELQSSLPLTLDPNQGKKKNIVLVTMESIERDQTTAYNPDVPTTPFLANVSQHGVKVENAYVDFAWTSKSLVSTFCGIPPNITTHITEQSPEGIKNLCLPHLLKQLGYKSAFFQTATKSFENRDKLAQNLGFDHFTSQENLDATGFSQVDLLGLEERAMLKPIMHWVDQQDSPFLLSILTLSGHDYTNKPIPSFPQLHLSDNTQHNNYLNAIRYVDLFLYELFSEFQQRQMLDDTLFIFTSDTGNHMKHIRQDYDPTDSHIKIPLIIWDSSLTSNPQSVSGLWQHTDILPTIIDFLGFKKTQGLTYGSSVFSKQDPGKSIHFVCKNNACLVRLDKDHKFVYRYNDEKTELYHTNDQDLETNIANQLPVTTIQQYIAELLEWKKQASSLHK